MQAAHAEISTIPTAFASKLNRTPWFSEINISGNRDLIGLEDSKRPFGPLSTQDAHNFELAGEPTLGEHREKWPIVLNRMLIALYLTLLGTLSMSAQSIEAKFSTEKANYLVGEPLFVSLVVSNRISEPIWLDFQSPDLAKLVCDDFGVEVPGAKPADEPWGCGFSGSCGRGLREVLPGKSISLRQLLNQQYRLEPGAYSLHARTNIVVHKQNFDSPQIEEADVSGTLEVKVQPADESQLKSVFRPIVAELADSDSMRRGEAAGAIIALAAPFLEDSLVELAKTNYAFGAIAALRTANTPKTRDALAEIGTTNDDPMLRIQAIRNLGRTGDKTYLPLLLRVMQSGERQIQSPAAEAVGTLGGAAAIPSLSALVSSSDAETRSAGANGLGMTRARQAVPILIAMLVDSDANVRGAAVSGLSFLTHRRAFDGSQWADISTADSASLVHGRWVQWWNAHANTSDIHGMAVFGGRRGPGGSKVDYFGNPPAFYRSLTNHDGGQSGTRSSRRAPARIDRRAI